ncbi:MAG TPA: hypothetical protein VI454_08950 [Verrucomicrobiae bacterium]
MKAILALILSLAALLRASAQISVEVQFEQDQYLPNEALMAKVRVVNFSGQTLPFGESEDWLKFHIESRDGYVVEKVADAPVSGKFELESSSAGTKRVNLAPYFNVSRPGRYLVSATVKIKTWDREWTSKSAGFDVIKGTKLWEQDFGVPRPGGAEPELRRYALLQAAYLKQLTLYARVSDVNEVRVFKVYPIGPMVSFSKPEGQVDKTSNLHVLWQVGARSFQYVVVNLDGETTMRQTYDYTDTRPTLRLDNEGRVVVWGGVRRETGRDFPARPEPRDEAPKSTIQP